MSLFDSILGAEGRRAGSGLFTADNPFKESARAARINKRARPAAADDLPVVGPSKPARNQSKRQRAEPGVGEIPEKARKKTKRTKAAEASVKERPDSSGQRHDREPEKSDPLPAPNEARKAKGLLKEKKKKTEKGGQTMARSRAAQDDDRSKGSGLVVVRAPAAGEQAASTVSPQNGAQERVQRSPEEEAERLTRTVFVGNLPVKIRSRRLKSVFAQYGKVESVRLRSLPIDLNKMMPRRAAIMSRSWAQDRGSAHAYIVFESASGAEAALHHNMQELDGNHIRVDRAGASKKGEAGAPSTYFDRSRSIFVGNLAFDVEDEDVIRFFNEDASPESGVAGVRIVRDAQTNLGKGFGFVLFADKNGARMALAKDGTLLKKRTIRVTRVASSGRITSEAAAARRKAVSDLGRFQGKTGYERRKLSEKGSEGKRRKLAPIASWQGLRTKGNKKMSKLTAAAAPTKTRVSADRAGGSRRPARASGAVEGRQRKTKRPAVIERKAKALGLPAPKPAAQKRQSPKGKRTSG